MIFPVSFLGAIPEKVSGVKPQISKALGCDFSTAMGKVCSWASKKLSHGPGNKNDFQRLRSLDDRKPGVGTRKLWGTYPHLFTCPLHVGETSVRNGVPTWKRYASHHHGQHPLKNVVEGPVLIQISLSFPFLIAENPSKFE